MSHYGIVKRNKYVKYPCYVETLKFDNLYSKSILKFSDMEKLYDEWLLKNAIWEQHKLLSLDIYWEGDILQDVFDIEDEININDEIFKIQKVEKNINGQVIYEVDDLIEKHNEYEILLKDCEMLYNNYKQILSARSEYFENLDDGFKEIKKELPWWQRLFH